MNKKVEVLIVGSGFGGATAAKRIAGAGRNVMMLERGPWRKTVPVESLGIKDAEPLPQGKRAWTRGIRSVGSHRMKKPVVLNKKGFVEAYFGEGISILCSSNVGGGSHIYAGFLDRPLVPDYWDNHHPEISHQGMDRYYDEIIAALGGRPLADDEAVPNRTEDPSANYNGLLTQLGNPVLGFLLPKTPGAPEKVTAASGLERWECDMKNNSFLGSPSGAKTTLDFAFIWPAVQQGLQVRDLCEAMSVHRLEQPQADGMRYEVRYRDHRTGRDEWVQAEHVILAAGGLNTNRLLLRSRDVVGGLSGMPRLGQKFSGNGDFFGLWKENSSSDFSQGMPIASPFRLRDSLNSRVIALRASIQGMDTVPMPGFIRRWLRKQSVMIAFGGDDSNGSMTVEKGKFRIRYCVKNNDIYEEINHELQAIQQATKTRIYAPRNPVTVHPMGGACLGSSVADGVVGANGEVFDNPGLYVADSAALPMAPGGAPSLTIAAWSANVADRLIARLNQKTAVQA